MIDAEMYKAAAISECKAFRYTLWRVWDSGKGILVVFMLNPSSADHEKNDPTVTTLIRRARAWGFGGIQIVNLYAFRTANPKKLAAMGYLEGPANEGFIQRALSGPCAQAVLVAWGNHPVPPERITRAVEGIRSAGKFPMVLGVTKNGAPKHPMARGKHRIPADQKLVTWSDALLKGV